MDRTVNGTVNKGQRTTGGREGAKAGFNRAGVCQEYRVPRAGAWKLKGGSKKEGSGDGALRPPGRNVVG